MHQAKPYGHLVINGIGLEVPQLARMVGCIEKEARRWMLELERAGVFSKTDAGVIYSRRMLRDEVLRLKRAEGGEAGAEYGARGGIHGTKGGRPRGDKKPPSDAPLNPPPSSSVFGFQSSEAAPLEDREANLAGTMATELRRKGVNVTSMHPTLLAWVDGGFSVPSVLEALAIARQRKPEPESIAANYIDAILRNPPKKAEPAWWSSDQRILAKGSELGLNPRPGEEMVTFKERIQNEIGKRKAA